MKNALVVVVVVALFVTLPMFAAVQYEFFQKSSSDTEAMPSTDMSARAIIEGDKSRIDVIGGNTYPPGTYVITTDGSRRVFFVDPTMKTYTEFNTAGVSSALGASTITIENLQSTVTPLDQGELIAGIPTKHYRVNLNYDITVVFRGVPLKQSVRTVVDKWMTLQFGDIAESMLASGQFRTGNAKIDELIDIETRKIKGLPLRQTATITTTNLRGASMNPELKLPTTRVLTREMRVTAIREAKPEANAFTVPSGFQRAEGAAPPKPEMQVITFTPPTK